MPLTIPAFDQYQAPLVPLRGLWNRSPPEGDRMINAEIDWLVTTRSNAVQFSLSGNSPVSISQIVALAVDNSRSGADCSFAFPDSGFELVVPAHNQIVAPVFTNALMFYASSPAAIAGDVTIIQIFNSNPPPIPIAPSIAQNHASALGVNTVNGSTVIIPSPASGTLNTISVNVDTGAGAGLCQLNLVDGAGHTVWAASPQMIAGGTTIPFNLTGLNVRFTLGLNLVITSASGSPGLVMCTVYYSTP